MKTKLELFRHKYMGEFNAIEKYMLDNFNNKQFFIKVYTDLLDPTGSNIKAGLSLEKMFISPLFTFENIYDLLYVLENSGYTKTVNDRTPAPIPPTAINPTWQYADHTIVEYNISWGGIK